MIVKKLGMVSGGGFPGAGYNERKVAEGVARLMAMENVDAAMRHKVELLHEAGFDCAGEIEKYLKGRSRTYGNTKTTRFQFHIAASVKESGMSADELTDFARQLMAEAGSGRQPYFVYYHHDTDNNHVHILSTRIQPNGFPIPDHHVYARLNAAANRILSSDINRDIQHMFSYGYLTEGQFANIIRSHVYKFERMEDRYVLFRGGVKAATISLSKIERHISQENDTRKERAKQLRAIIRKFKAEIADGSEREDVAIQIATTMFSTEIFESVLQKYPVSDINSRIARGNIIKMRDGGRAIRVVSSDGFSATYPITADELRCHAKLQDEAASGYLRQLAILRIIHEDATELTYRIKELTSKLTGSTILPLRQSDYTPEQAKAFTSHQCSVLTRLMPRDTTSTHSTNREWEVGKQSRYDHINNQQSGTQLTI